MDRAWATRAGLCCIMLLALSVLAACGDDDGNPAFLGSTSATSSPAPLSGGSSAQGQTLVDKLLRANFPNLKLNGPTSGAQTSLVNGTQLSDQQLNAGILAEVVVDLGGRDSSNRIEYDVFKSDAAANAWFQRFTLAAYPQFKLHGTYSPKGINAGKCEQFADVSGGRNAGGTQCFALDKSVVAYGDSIVYDTPSGNQQDAEAMVKAALDYVDSLK